MTHVSHLLKKKYPASIANWKIIQGYLESVTFKISKCDTFFISCDVHCEHCNQTGFFNLVSRLERVAQESA